MDLITVGGKEYPVRWDMAALKEYKSFTKNDAISGFEGTTENILALVFYGIKGGYRFTEQKFDLTSEALAAAMMPREIKPIIKVFGEQCGLSTSVEGELKPS
jgi:hypothetical protein